MMSLTRRNVLLSSLVLGCSAAANPLITPVSFAQAPGDNRLVVIVLRGAMDGLDVVQPYGDPDLRGHRPNFLIGPDQGALDLDGYFSLHPELAGLMPLWHGGELAFAHAVSTPYRNKRSHFDGQDILETGIGEVGSTSDRGGWLNRALSFVPQSSMRTAFAVGRDQLLVLEGQNPIGRWSPGTQLGMTEQAKLLLEVMYSNDPLFADAARTALDLTGGSQFSGSLDSTEEAMEMMVEATKSAKNSGRAKALASFAAEQLNGDARIAAFSINGWDTHRNQANTLKRSLGELQDSILALKATLGSNWQKTAVLCMTEFGRTVRENGSKGTDHGTGGCVVVAGGAIKGRNVTTRWPGLAEVDLFDKRDLMPTMDVRNIAAASLRTLFGIEGADIEKTVFPGLEFDRNISMFL
jgi:uncharacterized protein (DUF1501 family)